MQEQYRIKRCLTMVFLALAATTANAELRVVAVYEGQSVYLEAALAAESADLDALARKHIVEPYLDLCSAGLSAEDRTHNEDSLGRPITAFDELSRNLEELEKKALAARMLEFMRLAAEILPTSEDVTICIEARDPAKISDPELIERLTKGVAGQYYGAGIIWVSIYPFPGWFDVAKAAVPHEYHHFIRSEIERDTLLEVIVAEGLADAFSREIFDGWTPDPEWYSAFELEEDLEARLWAEMEPQLRTSDEDTMRRYLFGSLSGAEDLPPVPGYEFGRYIVNSYLQNASGVPVSEWSLLSAEEIFRVSGYAGSRTAAR